MNDDIRFLFYGEGRIYKGMLYPPRKSGKWELIFLASGCLYICEDYREYRLTEGDALLLDGGARHYGFRESDSDSFFTRIVFEGDPTRLYPILSQRRLFNIPRRERFTGLLDLMKLYYSLPEYPGEAVDHILYLMLTVLIIDGIPRGEEAEGRFELCGKICDYVRERNGIIKLTEIGEHFHYTTKYLSLLFCSYYARGLKSYVDAVRLTYLKLLLSSDMPLAEAAKTAGFDALKPMQDFFRYNTGTTINEWLSER